MPSRSVHRNAGPVGNRFTVWLIGGATAFSLLGDQALYATLPIFFDELGLRPIEVGVILSANRWVRLATNELAHRLTGVAIQRWLFVGAVALGALTTAAYSATPRFSLFVLARLAWGLCWSFIRHFGLLSVLESSGGDRVGRTAGRLSGIGRAGSVAGLLGGALLVDRLGFQTALLVLASLSAVAVPLAWAGFVPIAHRRSTASVSAGGPAVVPALGFAHGMVGPGLVMATLGAVVDDQLGGRGWVSAATLTGAILATRFVVETGAAARLGSISDRHGVRATCGGAFGAGTVALAVAALSPWPALSMASVVVFFIAGTTLGAGLNGFAGSRGSRALAGYATASDMGAASGPMVGWVALGLFDERTLGLGIGAVFYASAALAAHRLLPTQDRLSV